MKTLFLITSIIALSGCASIFQPGPNEIQVNSKPEGARVYLDNQIMGVTPMRLPLKNKDAGVIRVEKDGYQSSSTELRKTMSGTIFLNLASGPFFVIGTPIDLILGNQGHYSETPVYMELHEEHAVK